MLASITEGPLNCITEGHIFYWSYALNKMLMLKTEE